MEITTAYAADGPHVQAHIKDNINMREIHWSPVDFPHKGPLTRKVFPFDDVIMFMEILHFDTTVPFCRPNHTRRMVNIYT